MPECCVVVRDDHPGSGEASTEMAQACQRWFKVAAKAPKLAKLLAKEYPEIKKSRSTLPNGARAKRCGGRRRIRVDDLGSWPALARHIKADPERQLRPSRFHPCGRSAKRHLRRTNKEPHTDRRGWLARLSDRANRRRHLVAHKSQTQRSKSCFKLAQSKEYKHLLAQALDLHRFSVTFARTN